VLTGSNSLIIFPHCGTGDGGGRGSGK